MQVEELFREASERFEESDYAAGLDLMSRCIALSPRNSALFSNRALFHSQLGQLEEAVDDLTAAIRHNYLNYVAYFNLFSLQFNAGQTLDAFDNLCCSLSCLYLVRARRSRRELDVQRSIKYAENNPDAHILKALMYLDDGKNKLALNEIEWALDLGRYGPLCIKIKNIINRRLNPYSVSEIEDPQAAAADFRLHTSHEPAGSYEEEMRERVREFNEIYDELVNAEFGTVTQKVQRIRQDEPSNNHSRSRLISEISDIYEIKFKETSTNHHSKEKGSDAPTKEHLTNESDLLERHLEEASLENSQQVRQEEEGQEGQEGQRGEEENLLEDDSLDRLEHEFVKEEAPRQEHSNGEAVEFNLLDEQLTHPKEEDLLPPNVPSDNEIPHVEPSANANSSAASSVSEVVSLYPISARKKIQFTIISAEVKTPGKQKDFYLTGSYNSRKGQRLKTPNKKIEGNTVRWFTAIAPTPIAEAMQTVSVKLFSKQYFSYDDELIGEGEVEIIKSGEMKFPVYFKNKVTGFVNLRVDLI